MDYTEPEEYQHRYQGYGHEIGYVLHAYILLPAYGFCVAGAAFKLASGQTDGLGDYGPRFDDAYHTGHGYAADADFAGNFVEERPGVHGLNFGRAVNAHQRHDYPPYEHRAGKDYKSVFQSYDVAQAEQSGAGVAREYEFEFFGQSLAPAVGGGGDGFGPEAECSHYIVVYAADKRSHEQKFGLASLRFACGLVVAAYQHLCGGGGLREGVFAVHVLYEIFSERYEEQNAQHSAEQRTEEYLQIAYGYFGILGLQYVQSGKGKDGTCYNYARRAANRLYDNVLSQGIIFLEGR